MRVSRHRPLGLGRPVATAEPVIGPLSEEARLPRTILKFPAVFRLTSRFRIHVRRG